MKILDIIGEWSISENEGINHTFCGPSGTLGNDGKMWTRKAHKTLFCNNCGSVLPKSVVAYFMMNYKDRNWQSVDFENYKETR